MKIQNRTLFKQHAFINGKWIDSANGESLEVTNPSTQSILGSVPMVTAEQARLAISSANNAWKGWRDTPAKDRSVIIRKWYELIVANQEDLATIMTLE